MPLEVRWNLGHAGGLSELSSALGYNPRHSVAEKGDCGSAMLCLMKGDALSGATDETGRTSSRWSGPFVKVTTASTLVAAGPS